MTETLDLPPIADVLPPQTEAPALPTDLKRIDLQAVALAQFGDWRTDVAAARKNLGTLALDLSIPARIAEAKTLRQRLIGGPRAEVRKVATALKSRLAAVSKAVGAEADTAVAAYDAAETLITPQIEAAEQRIEDERLRKEREEEQRIHGLKLAVDAKLDPWMDRCNAEGMTAARVEAGMAALGELPMPPELADVAAYWAERLAATRMFMERRRLALAAQELEAAQAQARAEQARVAGIQARIAEIQAAATGHERASAADLLEARTVVAALDVSEAQYQEFTLLAQAARAGTLAVLDKLHAEAVEREGIEAAQRASTPAANVATAAAIEGKAENPEPGTLEAALNVPLGVTAQHAQEGVAQNPLQPEPAAASSVGDLAADGAGDEGAATPQDSPAAASVIGNPPFSAGNEFTEGQESRQVLKAEPATADASPRVGAMGAGQAADAAPAGDDVCHRVVCDDRCAYPACMGPAPAPAAQAHPADDDPPLETSEADARPYVAPLAAAPAPATDPRDEFVALVMTAFDCKFPSHPKPSQAWWAEVRAAGQALQGR
jgi:hypothetical protein